MPAPRRRSKHPTTDAREEVAVDAPVGPLRVPELAELEALVARGRALAGLGFEARVVARIAAREQSLPVWAMSLGNPDRRCPTIGFFGGVHGLERIGAGVVLAWMQHLLARAQWDGALRSLLERLWVLAMPVVNPGGLLLGTRANPDGIDLMRNAPVDADARVPWLVGSSKRNARGARSRSPSTATRASGCETASGFRTHARARPRACCPSCMPSPRCTRRASRTIPTVSNRSRCNTSHMATCGITCIAASMRRRIPSCR
jgi:hypothetical protein